MKTVRAIVALTLSAAALLACDDNPVEPKSDAQLTLSADSVVVGVFGSAPLIVTVQNASGAVPLVPGGRLFIDGGNPLREIVPVI